MPPESCGILFHTGAERSTRSDPKTSESSTDLEVLESDPNPDGVVHRIDGIVCALSQSDPVSGALGREPFNP